MFIYISVAFIVFAATMFMVNKRLSKAILTVAEGFVCQQSVFVHIV